MENILYIYIHCNCITLHNPVLCDGHDTEPCALETHFQRPPQQTDPHDKTLSQPTLPTAFID